MGECSSPAGMSSSDSSSSPSCWDGSLSELGSSGAPEAAPLAEGVAGGGGRGGDS